jgi:hypothetical protein
VWALGGVGGGRARRYRATRRASEATDTGSLAGLRT